MNFVFFFSLWPINKFCDFFFLLAIGKFANCDVINKNYGGFSVIDLWKSSFLSVTDWRILHLLLQLTENFYGFFLATEWRFSQLPFLQLMDEFHDLLFLPIDKSMDYCMSFFLPQAEKAMNQKGTSKMAVRPTRHVK